MENFVETIFAKSSGSGVAAICVLRISGPNSLKTLNKLLRSEFRTPPRQAVLRTLWFGGDRLDTALMTALFLPVFLFSAIIKSFLTL